MADAYIQVQPDSTGKKVDVSELTVNAQTVERQRVVIGDNATAGNYAAVTSSSALKVDGSAVTQPVSGTVSCNTHAVTQSGTWTVQPGNTANTTAWLVTSQPSTSGGLTSARLVSAASTNATSLKASAGQLYNLQSFNLSTSNKFVKFYNKASAPTVGTDTPVQTYLVPPGGGIVLEWSNGLAFATGIAYAVTGAYTDADTTAVNAGDVLLNLGYK